MSTATKLAVRRQHTGDFGVDQQQRLAQDAARKVNSHADMLNALTNRSYKALSTDTGNVAAAAYATLLTANITTYLASGYLVITFSASGAQITNPGTVSFEVLVDGVVVKGVSTTVPTATYSFSAGLMVRVAVGRGAHVVLVKWKTSVNSAHISASSVVEEHAHLLVQEAA